METKAVLDSDILIEFLRNKPQAIQLIKSLKERYELYTTDINSFELFYGAYRSKKTDKNIDGIKILLNSLQIIGTNSESAETSGKLMAELQSKGQMIEIEDILIGGICLANSCAIATNNKAHFQRMGIKILD